MRANFKLWRTLELNLHAYSTQFLVGGSYYVIDGYNMLSANVGPFAAQLTWGTLGTGGGNFQRKHWPNNIPA
jgi:hypothetical protein